MVMLRRDVDDLPGSERNGCLYLQRQKDKQVLAWHGWPLRIRLRRGEQMVRSYGYYNITEALNISGIASSTLKGTISRDTSCIMGVQERSARMMPEPAIVANEAGEKRIAVSIR